MVAWAWAWASNALFFVVKKVIPLARRDKRPLLFILSVWKVVPTLTNKSAEIYLSMAGANNTKTRIYPGSGRGLYVSSGALGVPYYVAP
jgi:hypothetical protein